MAYEVVMSYHLHMPSYFLGTFTEYPFLWIGYKKSLSVLSYVRLSILSNCCSEIIQLQLLRYLLQ